MWVLMVTNSDPTSQVWSMNDTEKYCHLESRGLDPYKLVAISHWPWCALSKGDGTPVSRDKAPTFRLDQSLLELIIQTNSIRIIGNLLQTQILRPHLRPTESESLSAEVSHHFFFFFRFYLFIFRERGSEGEREGQKHQCVVASRTTPTGDLAHNPHVPWLGIQPATLWFTACAQSTKPHQPVPSHWF